jgi:hypothetical protein
MLRVDHGVRGLGGDVVRRFVSKPLTAADADDPNRAAKSAGAAAANEFRVAAGAYRGLVPPGARAAYDRSTEETAASVNKQAADAFRARAQAAHEDNARAPQNFLWNRADLGEHFGQISRILSRDGRRFGGAASRMPAAAPGLYIKKRGHPCVVSPHAAPRAPPSRSCSPPRP